MKENQDAVSPEEISALVSKYPSLLKHFDLAKKSGETNVQALDSAIRGLTAENRRIKQSLRTRMVGPGIHEKLTPGPKPKDVV